MLPAMLLEQKCKTSIQANKQTQQLNAPIIIWRSVPTSQDVLGGLSIVLISPIQCRMSGAVFAKLVTIKSDYEADDDDVDIGRRHAAGGEER